MVIQIIYLGYLALYLIIYLIQNEYFVYISYSYISAECEVMNDCWKNKDEEEDILCVDGSCKTYAEIEDAFCTSEMNENSAQKNILSSLRKIRKV